MSSRYLILPEINKRVFFFKREQHSNFLKCLLMESNLFNNMDYIYFFYSFPFFLYISFLRQRNCYSFSTIRNRCLYNGSGRAVFSMYRLSRLSFKKYALVGSINGVTKSSW